MLIYIDISDYSLNGSLSYAKIQCVENVFDSIWNSQPMRNLMNDLWKYLLITRDNVLSNGMILLSNQKKITMISSEYTVWNTIGKQRTIWVVQFLKIQTNIFFGMSCVPAKSSIDCHESSILQSKEEFFDYSIRRIYTIWFSCL